MTGLPAVGRAGGTASASSAPSPHDHHLPTHFSPRRHTATRRVSLAYRVAQISAIVFAVSYLLEFNLIAMVSSGIFFLAIIKISFNNKDGHLRRLWNAISNGLAIRQVTENTTDDAPPLSDLHPPPNIRRLTRSPGARSL